VRDPKNGVTEVIGVSSESWEAAARNAVQTTGKTIRDLRIAEVVREDVPLLPTEGAG
jgi:flavin-binding protein dodecin